MNTVKIIGAGLAGCEAAYQLSKRGVAVDLFEQKPLVYSSAHKLNGFAELVCSNSLKSLDKYSASGLLKFELEHFDCLLLKLAKKVSVDAGSALAVDRVAFSQLVTETVRKLSNLTVYHQTVRKIDCNTPTIIATGPLTEGDLGCQLSSMCDGFLDFFDAVSPIVEYESIDMQYAFKSNRYDKHQGIEQETSDCKGQQLEGDYINCVLDKQQYELFYSELIKAERVQQKYWENIPFFESCMPIEVIASRGLDTMRFGPMRPVGIIDPKTSRRPYAVLQLRKENTQGNLYNLVGFQTSLKFGEQSRVFGLIPALKNAEYVRYGVMHRNSFINAPKVLNKSFEMKNFPAIFVAGQLSGVEGYVESIMSGLIAGINMANRLKDKPKFDLPSTTMCGALTDYLTRQNDNFSPINANFGILPPLDITIKDKKMRKAAMAERALIDLPVLYDA
ncbi:MAG: methylenetetrahydrofolate--tRNA-(uracil(54)-C(5))-methyltransferase (FADH(2)-oxidizing) TrmFO [Clostridiales bacterium]|jgi:methylenetetrahydrofolate--tRNA-(uracil-5-)-methyltransferase|nr:methylenetetrahydrofolate--tRNA-(uracil(54)-C(5))-methyltransferase (FADH(2)-oxidizing) TrmFO [Clostridiales bacterium]